MGDVSKGEGRTVLFVSHNMGSVRQLCSKAMLLSTGQLVDYDSTQKIVDLYLYTGANNTEGYKAKIADKEMSIMEAYTQNEDGRKNN